MKISISIIILLVYSKFSYGQNKTFDRIEMLYDQRNYKKVYKISDKLLSDNSYKNSPNVLLFHTLSEYQLAKSKSKFSKSSAILAYEKFVQMDPEGKFRNMYDIYIYDMQLDIVNEIRTLKHEGDEEKAKVKFATYERLFGKGASYETITKETPNIENPLTENSKTKGTRDQVIDYAKKFVGVPYKYGGNDKNGFDCSGYTQYVLANKGYTLPRTAQEQSDKLESIKITDAQKGDLLFFGNSKKNINHVGIVISEKGKELNMIHASSSRGIMISSVEKDPYWKPRLQTAARIIKE